MRSVRWVPLSKSNCKGLNHNNGRWNARHTCTRTQREIDERLKWQLVPKYWQNIPLGSGWFPLKIAQQPTNRPLGFAHFYHAYRSPSPIAYPGKQKREKFVRADVCVVNASANFLKPSHQPCKWQMIKMTMHYHLIKEKQEKRTGSSSNQQRHINMVCVCRWRLKLYCNCRFLWLRRWTIYTF